MIALHSDLARVTAERAAWLAENRSLSEELARTRERLVAALTDIGSAGPILCKRSRKPTDAEIDVHAAVKGMWLLSVNGCMWTFLADHAQRAKNMRDGYLDAQAWYAFDAKGVPCIGPVIP